MDRILNALTAEEEVREEREMERERWTLGQRDREVGGAEALGKEAETRRLLEQSAKSRREIKGEKPNKRQ